MVAIYIRGWHSGGGNMSIYVYIYTNIYIYMYIWMDIVRICNDIFSYIT